MPENFTSPIKFKAAVEYLSMLIRNFEVQLSNVRPENRLFGLGFLEAFFGSLQENCQIGLEIGQRQFHTVLLFKLRFINRCIIKSILSEQVTK
jgi:hypothetical protein